MIRRFLQRFSLFSTSQAGCTSVDNAAVDAAVVKLSEKISPNLKYDPKNERRLRDPVAEVLKHIGAVAEQVPGLNVVLCPKQYENDSRLRVIFGSSVRITEIVNQTDKLQEFYRANKGASECHAVLWGRINARRVLTSALSERDEVIGDVARVQHGYRDHSFMAHSCDPEGAQAGLNNYFFELVAGDVVQKIRENREAHRETRNDSCKKGFTDMIDCVTSFLEEPDRFFDVSDIALKLDSMGYELEGPAAEKAESVCFTQISVAERVLGVPLMVAVPRHVVDMDKNHGFNHELAEKLVI
ncbi:MAG: hypothetical protein H6861_01650 [Rhodospirillales bacterium]|nr:hypothetical protein [Rhodospirillales bacterium]